MIKVLLIRKGKGACVASRLSSSREGNASVERTEEEASRRTEEMNR